MGGLGTARLARAVMSAWPHQAGPTITVEEMGEMNQRDLVRIFGIAEALLAARELLAATAEMVGPDTPADELLRHLTQYRAHLSALAAGGLPLTETQRRLAGHPPSKTLRRRKRQSFGKRHRTRVV